MIRYYNGSMEKEIENVEDDSVDLLLTDPPYNISKNGANPIWVDQETGKNKNSIHNQKFSDSFADDWDAVGHNEFLEHLQEWSSRWYKKIRKGGTFAIFISDRYISFLWKIMEEQGFEPKRIITWKKPAAVPFNRKVNPVSGCEYILWGIKPGGKRTFNSSTDFGTIVDRYSVADKIGSIVYKNVKDNLGQRSLSKIFYDAQKQAEKIINGRKIENGKIQAVIPNTITFSGGIKNKIHPTQKPVEILEYLIELTTNPNDLVLDTFAGSGSTGLACINSRRNCILIEKDEKMYAKMIEQFSSDLDLSNLQGFKNE